MKLKGGTFPKETLSILSGKELEYDQSNLKDVTSTNKADN